MHGDDALSHASWPALFQVLVWFRHAGRKSLPKLILVVFIVVLYLSSKAKFIVDTKDKNRKNMIQMAFLAQWLQPDFQTAGDLTVYFYICDRISDTSFYGIFME